MFLLLVWLDIIVYICIYIFFFTTAMIEIFYLFALTDTCPGFDSNSYCGKDNYAVGNCGVFANLPYECPVLCSFCEGTYRFSIIQNI